MTNLDSTRDSRDGDQFHYFWAARQCLKLLDYTSDLVAVAVEGPAPNDSTAGLRTSSAHEIDVAEYYGGTSASDATRIWYRQLKHSTKQRDLPWGPVGLKSSISRFAGLYKAAVAAPRADPDKYGYQFVSNRPVSENVQLALSELAGFAPLSSKAKITRDKFVKWANLAGKDLEGFFQRFDVDTSAPALRELASVVARDLGEVLPGPNSDATLRVKEMVVERATTLNRAPVYRGDLLVALKTSEADLFPAPTLISARTNLVKRESWTDVVDAIRKDPSPHIVHASGGIGKTTFALSLPSLLRSNDFSVVYDCYANGAYRKLGEARHNPEHGFVQLANTLASYGLCQVLVPDANVTDEDWARAFLARVGAASSAISLVDPGAVLVFVIDAADSSVLASRADVAARPFVKSILRQTFPNNVRVVLTARTERVEDLDAPPNAVSHILEGFDRDESAVHLRERFQLATDIDAREFHQRTFGNPRVQTGALAGSVNLVGLLANLSELPDTPAEALESILQRRVDEVLDESPESDALVRVLHVLASLRPRIPIAVVEQLTGAAESTIRSFASDLGGPVLLDGDALQFRDEPTESLIRDRYMPSGGELTALIDAISPRADSSVYLASSLPQLLWEIGDLEGLLVLAMSDDALPTTDVFERQRVDQTRSVFAVRAALTGGRAVEAAILAARCGMLHAGGSRRTALLTKHPDLGGELLDEVTIEELVSDRKTRSGSIPASLAREGCLLSMNPDSAGHARSRLRSADSWVRAWSRLPKQRRKDGPVDDTDIANIAFGLLNTDGATACVSFLLSWQPDDVHYRVARIVFARLLDRNDAVAVHALARAAATNVRVLLAYASAAFDANRNMVPGTASALVGLLQERKTIVTVVQPSHLRTHQVPAAVSWAIACAIRQNEAIEPEMAILVQRYVPASAPNGLASDHNDRNEEAFYAIGLRARLTGETLTDQHFADPRLKQELAQTYSSTRDTSDFRGNIPQLLPWIDSWVRVSLGDIPASLPPISGLPTTLSAYRPAYTYAHSAPRIAARLVVARPDSSRIAELEKWTRAASYVWYPTATTIAQFLAGGDPAAQDLAIEVAADVAQRLTSAAGDAESRSQALAELARAVLCASADEAREYFTRALEQAEKAGDDMPNLWEGFLKVAEKAAESGTANAQLTYRIGRLAEDLEPNFEVDFKRVLEVCCKVNLSGGMSVASRWRDRRTAWLGTITSALVGNSSGPLATLDQGLALAFGQYGAYVDKAKALELLIGQPGGVSADRKAWVANHISRRIGEHPSADMRTILEHSQIPINTADLHPDDSASGSSGSWATDAKWQRKQVRERSASVRRARGQDLTSPDGLLAASRLLRGQSGTESFADLAFALPRTKWSTVIRALTKVDEFDEYDYRAAFTTMSGIHNLPASSKTAAKELVHYVVSRFANEMSSRTYELIPFSTLATLADISVKELTVKLFASSARGVDFSDSETSYGVLGNLANVLSGTEAIQVVEHITQALSYLTSEGAPDGEWSSHLEPPQDPWLAAASFVWGTLADPDADIRWRGTYVVVALCELGNRQFMAALNEIAQQGTPTAFVDNRLTFYELHADLWLLIALSRANNTTPAIPAAFSEFLSYVTGKHPAHALINQIANQISGTPEKPPVATVEMGSYDRPDRNQHKFWVSETSFKFDGDFVEYWLEPLASCFQVSLEDVERDTSDVIRTVFGPALTGKSEHDARRTLKIFRDDEKTYVYKSDDPEVHDLDFYLSYHAMMMVAAKLQQTMTTYREPGHELDDFQRWIRRQSLTREDGWLVSDLRSARPASIQHQLFSSKDPDWRWSVRRSDFLPFVQNGHRVTIDLESSVRGFRCSERVRVNSALVTADRDLALVRSFQVDRGSFDYRVPVAGDGVEIREPGYTFMGWIDDWSHDLRLDRADPFAKGLSFPSARPAEWVIDGADLKTHPGTNSWIDRDAQPIFAVDSWNHEDGPREDRGESGQRLHVDKIWLDEFLTQHSMSLIVKVAIDRSNKPSYQSTKNNEEWLEYVDSYTQILLYRPDQGWLDYRGHNLAR